MEDEVRAMRYLWNVICRSPLNRISATDLSNIHAALDYEIETLPILWQELLSFPSNKILKQHRVYMRTIVESMQHLQFLEQHYPL